MEHITRKLDVVIYWKIRAETRKATSRIPNKIRDIIENHTWVFLSTRLREYFYLEIKERTDEQNLHNNNGI